MSIFKKNLGLFGLSFQSDRHSTNSRISRLVCATLLAGLFFVCVSAKAYTTNVLVNPGAETGDLTGWTPSLTGYIYVVSTNGTIPGSGNSNFLAHSGKYTFQLFNTTMSTSYIYQDYAAISNSQWSADCYAICYASNYFQFGANSHMQIVFYDISNNVVPYPGANGGTFGTAFLDPALGGSTPYIITPPMATDATGWLYLQATNLYDADPATEASFDSVQPGLTIWTAPPGTAKVRYQLAFDNTATDGGDVYFDDCELNKLNMTDPDITNPPVALTVYAGATATFVVGASHTGAYPNEKLAYQWQLNGTNLPAAGGVNNINGSTTTPTLFFTNCSAAAAGLYDCVVQLRSAAGNYTNNITTVPVPLTVLTLSPLQKVNTLGVNSGFEGNPSWIPWNIFNGCNFATAANVYGATTTPVNVLDGSSVALVGDNGDRDNGFWNAIPATPGTVWKAGGWAYISSLYDLTGGNTCRLQIWFKGTYSGASIAGTSTYESFKLYGTGYTNADAQYVDINTNSPTYGQTLYHTQLPRDQWVYLPVTNVVNNGGIGLTDDLPYATFPSGDFMVPTNAGTAYINFQVYEYVPVAADNPQADLGGVATAGVYWDDMELIQVLPVTNLTASVSGGNVNLSFAAGAGLDYTVLYKTNLTDATWNVLTSNVAAPLTWQTNVTSVGTTYPVTVSDPINGQHSRFYQVQSQ